jgi:hypothetical protein
VPALTSNPELLLRAFVETAKDLFPTPADPRPWLRALRNEALTGKSTRVDEVLSNLQDWGASNVAHQGSATNWIRELSAVVVAELCQAALDQLTAEAAGISGTARTTFGAFDSEPSTLG